jgi:hydrogenase-4 component F
VTSREWLSAAVLAVPLLGIAAVAAAPRGVLGRVGIGAAVATAGTALSLAIVALADPSHRELGRWIVVDTAGGLIVGVVAVVGLASAAVSPQFLAERRRSLFKEERADRVYWATLFAFWTVLLAVPLAGNLGAAWLAVEATTAASALLVGFSGRPRALEAGWKYLILTSLGLGIALLGVLVLAAAAGGGGVETLTWRSLPHATLDPEIALVAYVLLLAGLAAKIGWAPVHNWLPDAHSEAPAPVSALLSAALLPAVLLVAWRSQQSLAPTIGTRTAGTVLVAFGLVSLAVAVPFLWRSQPWKRLLAYSSLEHMGVIALGVGFGGPLAIAGVAVHITGHAIAKALGFYAATPLLGHEPRAAGHAVGGIGRTQPALGATLGISLGALAGMPPSPLFLSEVLIVAGGFQAGRPWAAGAAAILLALGFLGLAHALVDTVIGRRRHRDHGSVPGLRAVVVLSVVGVAGMLALTAAALWLPGSAVVDGLLRGLA